MEWLHGVGLEACGESVWTGEGEGSLRGHQDPFRIDIRLGRDGNRKTLGNVYQAIARQIATAATAPAASAANPARTACRVRRIPMEPKYTAMT